MGLGDIVKIVVTGDSEGAKRALKSAQTEAGKTGHSFSNMAKVGALGFAGLAAGAVEFGRAAVHAAEDEQTSHVKLLTALKNNHQAWKDQRTAIEAADKAGEHFGYTTADTEAALAQGETATGSMKKTLDELTIAQNLAAMTGDDLSTAMTAVEKAGEGNLRPLKAMGVDLPIVASSAEKTKVAFEAWGKAQQHVKDVQDAMHTGATKTQLADNAAVAKATQALTDAEQRYATAKHHTVGQIQAITRAHAVLTAAEAKAADGSNKSSDTVKKALEGEATAQKKYSDLAHAGTDATEALRKKVANAAADQAKTFKGQMADLHAKWVDFEAFIGTKIIPVVEKLMKVASDPKTFKDIAAGWYVVEVAVVRVANAAIHTYNAIVDVGNVGKKIFNWLPGKKTTLTARMDTITVDPPDLSNPTVQPTQALKNYEAAPSLDGRQWGAGHVHHTTHIHMHAQPTPAMIKKWTDAYNKRNGAKAPNAKHTATSP